MDVSDPANPSQVGYLASGGRYRQIEVSNGHAYVASGSGGLRVFDLVDPITPVLKGSIDTPGFARGVAVSGNYAFVADGNLNPESLNLFPVQIAFVRATYCKY